MNFIDRVKLEIKAGDGGNGIVSYRREKYVPLGGPNGGDGGNIVFQVDTNKSTLLDLRYNKKIKAESGGNGKTKKMHGARGNDFIIKVPQGTIIKDMNTGNVLADLVHVNQSAIIAKGGRGGRGNYHYMSSRNPAPDYSELGEPGEERTIQIELKLLADVGLVGFPSVGKSTLLSVVSKAKPEIASYEFTTLAPNLGVVQVPDGRSFVMADLPGLIQGAAEGKGLGHQFLRHIERCRVILHVLDMGAESGRDPVEDFKIINEELGKYQYRLLERPQVVVANKMDLEAAETNLKRFQEAYPDIKVFPTTTIIHEGLEPVLYAVADLLEVTPEFPIFEEKSEGVLYQYQPEEPDFIVKNLGNGRYELTGDKLIKLFKMTNFNTESAVNRFAQQLRKMGVDEKLREIGAVDGDIVQILDYEFEFVE